MQANLASLEFSTELLFVCEQGIADTSGGQSWQDPPICPRSGFVVRVVVSAACVSSDDSQRKVYSQCQCFKVSLSLLRGFAIATKL